MKFGVAARGLVSAIAVVAAGCGDSGRGGDEEVTSNASASVSVGSITNMTVAGTTSPDGPTSAGPGGVTEGGTGTSDGVTSQASDGPKFDLGEQPMNDLGMMDGPIIPTTCAEAASGKSTVGCKFYAVDMDSHDSVETSQYAIGVANVQLAGMANVTIETKEGGVWQVVGGPTAVGPLQLFTFNLPDRHQDDTGLRVGGAYRVTADVPVVAYQFNPVDGASSFLSDAAMLYPAASLDTVNHVTAWTSMMDNTNGFQHSYATVIATVDGTMVTIDPKTVTAAGAGVPQGAPGAPYMVAMQEGDVLNVAVQSLGTSMTGTKVNSNADHPVAVFAGQECALIPAAVCCCDHMEEQLAGVRLWGKSFIAARMPVRNPGAPEQTLWQIYAAENGTTVKVNYDPGVTGIPAPQFVLNQGEVSEMYVSGPPGEEGDFEVIADKPIAVYGYMVGAQNFGSAIGDPAMVAMAPSEQFLPRYVILVPGTWINDVAVVTRPTGAQILLDGVAIPDASFNPVAASGFEVARVSVPDGVHVFDGGDEPFSVIIVGYDEYDSYAYLGGTGTGKINPNPPG
ncbi:MAG: IgGFc-binding protein [Nannocystis sp.]|uniref:IgGFc-binding protein n=1 Tax=Nannocystis sp. TaxID=1962667 RepID=UPI00242584C5|nr:IgGFc-binding protein [Nannocystis sp.]MBK9756706.1 IgGFc-binding protein [Nannocystis sp.]